MNILNKISRSLKKLYDDFVINILWVTILKFSRGSIAGLTLTILILYFGFALSNISIQKSIGCYTSNTLLLDFSAVANCNNMAVVFAVPFSIFILLFLLRELAVSREQELLELEIKTQPPRQVFRAFEGNVKESHLLWFKIMRRVYRADNSLTLTEIEECINYHLWAMLNLIVLYIPQEASPQFRKRRRYAANYMEFKPIEEIKGNEEYITKLKSRMKRQQEVFSLDELEGVLDSVDSLSLVLSANSSHDPLKYDTDNALKKVAFPIPVDYKSQHNDKSRVLPGAPTAYEMGFDEIKDTHKLLSLFDEEKEYDIARGVFESGHNYFTTEPNGRLVRSFVSIAVNFDGKDGPKRVGVINFHCDETDIFVNTKSFSNYRNLITPILSDTAVLVEARKYFLLKDTANS